MTTGRHAVLRCGRCGKFVDWESSRLQVVCECRPHLELPPVLVREATEQDRQKALRLFERNFGTTTLIASGVPVALDGAAMLAAESEREVAGALAWQPADPALHILAVVTDPMWQRAGVAGYLLAELEIVARQNNHPQIIASLTNDNLPALYFYQRHGYRISRIVRDIATILGSRSGFAGIPAVDEIQLMKVL